MRMLAGEAGEFEAEMTQIKWEDGMVVMKAKGSALWSPLPVMGVWDMKMSLTRAEIPRVLRMMLLFALKDGVKLLLPQKKTGAQNNP